MAKGMPEQQQSGQDNSLDLLWMMALVLGGIIAIWYFGKAYITAFVYYWKAYEIVAIRFIFNLWLKVASFIKLAVPITPPLEESAKLITGYSGGGTNFSTIVNLCGDVGNYLKYPWTALSFLGAALLYFSGPEHKFRHTFDTKSLRLLEQGDWPQITPIVKLDLVNQQLDDGPWAIALSPMRYCKKYNLLAIEKIDGRYQVTLHRGAAYRALSLQLGPRWRGPGLLPPHLRALFAIFVARINADKKASDALLDQIAASAFGTKLDFTGVDELIRKYGNSKKVAKIVNIHGYITTVMASLLVGAREVGVLASSEFIWLKPIDRRMWYMLNSVGRPTAVAEIAGAFAHWLAEKKLGLALMVPMVEEAVRGMELSLSEMIYVPDEEE